MVEFPYCVGRLLRALVEPFENGRCYHLRRYGRDPHSSPPNPGGCMPPGWWVYGLGAICAVSALLWLLRGRILCKPASLQRLLAKALGLCPCARLFRSAGLWIQAPANAPLACLRGLARFRAMLPVPPGHRVAIQLSRFRASALAGESPVNRSRNAERPPRPKRGGLSAAAAPSRRPNRNQSNRRGQPPGAHAGTNPSAGRRRFERKLNHPGEAGQPDPEQLSGSPDPATPPGDESRDPHIPKPRPKRKPRPACCPAAPRSRTCGTSSCTSPGSPARRAKTRGSPHACRT